MLPRHGLHVCPAGGALFRIFPIPAYLVTCAHGAAWELKKPRFYKDRLPEERLSKRSSGFFCRHHSKEHIVDEIASGNMGVLVRNNVIAGAGCFDGNHITGVYVLPSYQEQGCGSYIINCLEKEIYKTHNTVILDASLPGACLYEHRGYKTVGHGICELKNDVKLVYEIMEKKLKDN